MRKSTARVRSFTLKSNGKRFDVITPASKTDQQASILEDARTMSERHDLHGYFMVSWDKAGYRQGAYSWKDALNIAPAQMPLFAAEAFLNLLRDNGDL